MSSTTTSSITTNNDPEISTSAMIFSIFLLIIILIWCIASFTGFIMSIICISYDGSSGSKIAGILLALFFGPFYWLYYIYRKTYCTNNNYYYPQ
jgi:hypothetical protein